MPQVQIQIVTWNSRPHLERLFRGIKRQTGVDYNVVVIDNGSRDGTVEWIKQNFSVVSSAARNPLYNDKPENKGSLTSFETTRKVLLIQNQTNRGFAAAHNQGFAACQAPYVLVLNPDTELQEGYLAEVVKVMESELLPSHPPYPPSERGGFKGVAAVQGKLYKELPGEGKYGIIDSCGLEMRRLAQVVDIGQNEQDSGNFGAQKEIFGATGACALYRLEALKQVADKHGIFDERFGSYKEDVDLAWRFRRLGWRAVFTPKAVAWHGRGVGRGDAKSWRVRWLSWRNQVLMMLKNVKV